MKTILYILTLLITFNTIIWSFYLIDRYCPADMAPVVALSSTITLMGLCGLSMVWIENKS